MSETQVGALFRRLRSRLAYAKFRAAVRARLGAARAAHQPTREIVERQRAVLHAALAGRR